LVQFVSLSASPNAAAWFSDFDSVHAWVSLLLLKGLYFSSGLLAPGPGFGAALPLLKKFATVHRPALVLCKLLQGETGIIFELSDKKLEFFSLNCSHTVVSRIRS
jgi:hypothetical protein